MFKLHNCLYIDIQHEFVIDAHSTSVEHLKDFWHLKKIWLSTYQACKANLLNHGNTTQTRPFST